MIINTEVLLAAYPVGSLYFTTNSINPKTLFGGTWEQLTGDAYLKIVTSKPGQYNGTSTDHKIPIASMPKHDHTSINNAKYDDTNFTVGGGYMMVAGNPRYAGNPRTGMTGSGQAYYPYYYGIYVWRRTA